MLNTFEKDAAHFVVSDLSLCIQVALQVLNEPTHYRLISQPSPIANIACVTLRSQLLRGCKFEIHCGQLYSSRQSLQYTALGMGCTVHTIVGSSTYQDGKMTGVQTVMYGHITHPGTQPPTLIGMGSEYLSKCSDALSKGRHISLLINMWATGTTMWFLVELSILAITCP